MNLKQSPSPVCNHAINNIWVEMRATGSTRMLQIAFRERSKWMKLLSGTLTTAGMPRPDASSAATKTWRPPMQSYVKTVSMMLHGFNTVRNFGTFSTTILTRNPRQKTALLWVLRPLFVHQDWRRSCVHLVINVSAGSPMLKWWSGHGYARS